MLKLLRVALLSIAGLCALVISLRALLGPFVFLLPVNSPINAESAFGLAFTMLLVLRSAAKSNGRIEPPVQGMGPARSGGRSAIAALALLALVTAICFWRSLSFYFLSDDFVLLKLSNSFSRDYLLQLLTRGGGDGFFRPAGYISLGLNARWAGYDPFAWHFSGLLIHISNSALVFLLAESLAFNRVAAFAAAALFAMHGTRPEAVAWVAGRFDLLATFFVLAGLLFFLRYSREGRRADLILALACQALALLSKETAYVFPLLLLLPVGFERGISWRSLRLLLPFLVLEGLALAHRWSLFGGIGGYRDPGTGAPQLLALGAASALKALALRTWAALYFPVNWSVQPDIYLAFLVTVYIFNLLWLARSQPDRRRLLLAIAFAVIPALPALPQLLIGSDLQKSRLLYLPSVGFSLLAASLLQSLGARRAAAAAAILLAFNIAALNHNLKIWGDIARLARNTCAAAAELIGSSTKRVIVSGLPPSLRGVYFYAKGFPECLEIHSGLALESLEILRGENRIEPNGALILSWDPAREELVHRNRS